MKRLSFLFLFCLLLAQSAYAATRYVDNTTTSCSTPSDTDYDPSTETCGSGTETVYTTVSACITAMSASDTCLIKNGTYAENITAVAPTGTLAVPTEIRGESEAGAIIKPVSGRPFNWSVSAGQTRTHIKFSTLTLESDAIVRLFVTTNGRFGNITFEDVTFNSNTYDPTEPYDDIVITCGSTSGEQALGDWTLRRVTINGGGTGIYYQCPRALIEHSVFNNISRNGVLLQTNGWNQPDMHTVRYNICKDSGWDTSSNEISRCFSIIQKSLVHNNIAYGNDDWGFYAYGGSVTNSMFYNNTAYGNGIAVTTSAGGFFTASNTTGISLINNISYGNSGSEMTLNGTSITNTTNTTTDPSFINAGADNFNVPFIAGTDLTSSGVLHNKAACRGALCPMEFASASTLDANTVRVTLYNSFGALRNATTTTGWSCKVNTVAKTVTAASSPGATLIDLDIDATMAGGDTVICSYNSATGSLLNSIGIGNKTDATGNAYLLSFTDQAVANTLTGSGPGDTPPTIGTVAYSEETADTTTPDIIMPASIAAGDLLLAFLSFNGVPTISTFTGWTQMCYTTNTNVASAWYYKIAAGTESDTTYTISSAEDSTTRTWRIPVAEWHGTTPPECAITTGTGTTPDPPNLTPSWGAENLLWAAAYSRFRGDAAVTAYPTNFDDNQYTDSTGTTSDSVSMAIASRALNAASLDPGAFTVAGAQNWIASTVSVRPVSSGGDTGADATVWEQRNYCWKDWQDAESVACKTTQDTAAKGHANAKIVARIGIGITTDNPDPVALVGQYKVSGINTIDWTPLTDSCTAPCVKYAVPSVRSNGEATTRLLTLPGGLTFAAGALQALAGASAAFDYAQNAWVEFDQSIELVELSSGDTVEVRMVKDGGNLLNTYTRNATLNVIDMQASAP